LSSVEYLAAFKGIHATLAAEEKLKAMGAQPSLIPSPRVIESDCGFSVLLQGSEEAVRSLWAALAMPGALYRVTRKEGERRYDEIR
jgi:Protein of unknown function (DUF3343)